MSRDWFGDWPGHFANFGLGINFGAGQRSRFFESGEVRLAILSLLSEGPKHGYQLMKEMKDRSGGIYKASAGSVYPTLQQLEDEGLIESERIDGRRVYNITVAGRAELERDPDAVRRIWDRAESWEDWSQYMGPECFAIFAPVGTLVKSAFRAARWANAHPDRQDQLREILQRSARELDDLIR